MQIIYGDLFKQECEKKFKISREEITKTVRGPDEVKRIRLDPQREILYYLKKFPDGHFLLVECDLQGQNGIIGLSYKLDKDFLEGTSGQPLEVLEKFANTFGQTIEIGNKNANFFMGESFPIPQGDASILRGPDPKGHQIIPNLLMRVRNENNQKYVDISIAYSLDVDAYVNYLLEKGL